jgi:hypothetical protein
MHQLPTTVCWMVGSVVLILAPDGATSQLHAMATSLLVKQPFVHIT